MESSGFNADINWRQYEMRSAFVQLLQFLSLKKRIRNPLFYRKDLTFFPSHKCIIKSRKYSIDGPQIGAKWSIATREFWDYLRFTKSRMWFCQLTRKICAKIGFYKVAGCGFFVLVLEGKICVFDVRGIFR